MEFPMLDWSFEVKLPLVPLEVEGVPPDVGFWLDRYALPKLARSIQDRPDGARFLIVQAPYQLTASIAKNILKVSVFSDESGWRFLKGTYGGKRSIYSFGDVGLLKVGGVWRLIHIASGNDFEASWGTLKAARYCVEAIHDAVNLARIEKLSGKKLRKTLNDLREGP
jgi:hypothetical protein